MHIVTMPQIALALSLMTPHSGLKPTGLDILTAPSSVSLPAQFSPLSIDHANCALPAPENHPAGRVNVSLLGKVMTLVDQQMAGAKEGALLSRYQVLVLRKYNDLAGHYAAMDGYLYLDQRSALLLCTLSEEITAMNIVEFSWPDRNT